MKRDLTKVFTDEVYSKTPMRKHPINRIVYNHIDEKWSIDLVDVVDYKISNNKGYINTFIIIDNFSKYLLPLRLKNKTLRQKQMNFQKLQKYQIILPLN